MAGIFVPLDENIKMTGYIKEGLKADQAVDKWLADNQLVTERWMAIGGK
jgi:ABC-type proline/glycine betaine transport system substrate-binding protein